MYKSNDKPYDTVRDCIEFVYSSFISILNTAADKFVPKVKKSFSNSGGMELQLLKEASVESNRSWIGYKPAKKLAASLQKKSSYS